MFSKKYVVILIMWSDEEFDDNIVEPSGTNEKFLWSAMTGNIKVMKEIYDKSNSVLFVR